MLSKMGNLIEEETRSGRLLITCGLLPASKGGSILRSSGGRIAVMDGPFAETKEVVAGFAILNANSLEEAIESARRFMQIAGDGVSELRPILEGGDCSKT
jgi:hypothetical protein